MNEYKLPFVESDTEFDRLLFTELKSYHWEAEKPYRPRTYFKMAVVNGVLTARLLCFEAEPRAVYTERDEPAYKDSCLEFFVAPVKDREEYINIESTSNGTFLCEFGKGKTDRRFIKEITKFAPRVKPFKDCIGEMCWGVTVTVPNRLIAELYGIDEADLDFSEVRANFYKCGDDCETPHYLAFSPVTTLPPGFHNPECFAIFKGEEIK